MLIAIFSELYAPSIGGQEALFQGLAKALTKLGHEIEVYTIGHVAGLAEVEDIDGVRVYRYPMSPSYKAPRIKSLKRKWVTVWRYARYTADIAATGRHDVYLLNQWPFLHAATLPAAARSRALLHWCEIRTSLAYRVIQALLPRRVRLNAAISAEVGAKLLAVSGCPTLILPSGLDLTRALYEPQDARRDIVTFGRIAEHKNVPLAIAAFELLRDRGYTNRLLIAGDGPDMAHVRGLIAASPHGHAIELTGFVDDAEKFRMLSRCEVMAVPSRREGFPHVVSEAMCCGLPVVTANFTENGTQDVVKGYGIGLVTGQTPAEFADGIEAALNGWTAYSRAGLAAAATLSWEAIAKRLEQQLVEATGDKARDGGRNLSEITRPDRGTANANPDGIFSV